MRSMLIAFTSVLVAGVSMAAELPGWAYGYPPGGAAPAAAPGGAGRGAAPPAPDTSMKTRSGSSSQFTLAQIRDGFGPADWYPGDHPAMPDIVAHGKKSRQRDCVLPVPLPQRQRAAPKTLRSPASRPPTSSRR